MAPKPSKEVVIDRALEYRVENNVSEELIKRFVQSSHTPEMRTDKTTQQRTKNSRPAHNTAQRSVQKIDVKGF